MKPSKVLKILKAFKDEDYINAEEFLASPFFKTKPKLLELYRYFIKYRPDFNHADLSKEVVFDRFFPSKTFKDQTIRDLYYQLSLQLENYLAVQHLIKEENYRKLMLVKAYARRNDVALFEQTLSKRLKELENTSVEEEQLFWEKAKLYRERYFHPSTSKYGSSSSQLEMTQAQSALDNYYLTLTLQHYCELLLRSTLFEEKGVDAYLSSLVELLLHKHQDHPCHRMYQQIIQLFEETNSGFSFYRELVREFINLEGSLSFFDKKYINRLLISYGNFFYNKGHISLIEKLWELNCLALEKGFLISNGFISSTSFTNIVSIGARLKHWEITEKLIEKYKVLLEPKEKDSAIKLAWAYFYYYRGMNHDQEEILEALKKITEISYIGPHFNLRLRSLNLRIYFYLDVTKERNLETFNLKVKNFKRYLIKDKELSVDKKNPYFNFNRFIVELARLSLKKDNREGLEELRKKILLGNVAVKGWLMDKIGELQSSPAG